MTAVDDDVTTDPAPGEPRASGRRRGPSGWVRARGPAAGERPGGGEVLPVLAPWTRRRGLRLPAHRATTAHSCTLYPWGVHGTLGYRGPYLGSDLLAGGGAFHFDVFEVYDQFAAGAGSVTNTNVMILGKPGMGKSALVKSLLYRTAAVYGADRFLAIVDVKSEYGALADVLGLPVVKLTPGGSTRVNPLDIRDEVPAEDRARRRTAMVQALLGAVLARPLTAVEEVSLWSAITAIDMASTEPTLADLAGVLTHPTESLAAASRLAVADLAAELRDVSFGLDKLISRSLRGMFDGTSTTRINPGGRGVVIDLSAVQHDTDALPLVMVAATAWLQDILTTPTPARKLQVLDESWRMVQFEATARYLQAAWKLGRSYGIANIAILHKPGDLGSQANDGSATAKISAGLVADTSIRVSFAQTRQDLTTYGEVLGFGPNEQATIAELVRGESLWKIGNHTAVLDHHLAGGGPEAALCDTDQAFRQAMP